MKPEKKFITYPSNDLFKMVGSFIYTYKDFVDELAGASVDLFVQAGYKRKVRGKAQDPGLDGFTNPGEIRELQPLGIPGKKEYDLITLKNHCVLIQQKNLLIKKIRTQSEVYANLNASMLRNLAYNLAGLVLIVVVAVMYQRISINPEPAIGRFGILFKCISIYLVISILYQSLKAFVNTIISKHELLFWKKTMVGLLDEKEYTCYIIKPLSGLKKSLYVIYPFVMIIYINLSYYSYKFPHLLQAVTFNGL